MKRFLPDRTLRDLEPTPERVFFNRRAFLRAAGGALIAPVACAQDPQLASKSTKLTPPLAWPTGFAFERNEQYTIPSGLKQDLTPRNTAASHNNYYEFLFGKGGPVWKYVGDFTVDPWTVEITGECRKPMKLDLDDLFRRPHEERLYHFRCVERWAMNVPWCGFPLRQLLEQAEPTGNAKFVRFFSAHRPAEMPGLQAGGASGHQWPYYEGLRLDEAMNELTLVATGVYGRPLLKQHGAPLRIVVPWKYGYKNPKSITRIELVREQPPTFWSAAPYAHEYGFLSNVNPFIPHPRWSQAQSHWLDSRRTFPTPIFNGYGTYVASLYPEEPREPQPPLRHEKIAR